MRTSLFYLLFTLLLLISCDKKENKHKSDVLKDSKRKELIFKNINNHWSFKSQPTNLTAAQLSQNWTEWRLFLRELSQKPKSTIGAFQQKARALSVKIKELSKSIPEPYNTPAVKSRISVLSTKINALDMYIHLDPIPDDKVVVLIAEINTELLSLESQMDEIVRKNAIPKEEGETEVMKMLDTTRAIPTN